MIAATISGPETTSGVGSHTDPAEGEGKTTTGDSEIGDGDLARPSRLKPLRIATAEAFSAKEPAAYSDVVAKTRPCVASSSDSKSTSSEVGLLILLLLQS